MRRHLAILFGCAVCAHAASQVEHWEMGTAAIVNARIVTGTGQVIEKGTVLMSRGVIVQVGLAVEVPKGGQVTDGTGLTVYPGFIDLGTTKGLGDAPPRAQQTAPLNLQSEVKTAFHTSWDALRPEIIAADLLKPTDPVWGSWQSSGFTTALVYPAAGVVKGTASLVNLGVGGARDLVVERNAALVARMDAGFGAGSYPGSMLGAFAAFRQLVSDARDQMEAKAAFAGGSPYRPKADPAHVAMVPFLAGTKPVIFEADSEAQIDRALLLADRTGVKRRVILGGLRAFRLKAWPGAEAPPLIVALNFPPEPPPPAAEGDPEFGTESPERAKERQRLFEEMLGNAGALEKSGARFAFSTRGTESPDEFLKNLRRAVKAGLSADGALMALTVNAAEIMGLSKQLGTVEAKKIANLTVTTGDFLDEKSKVKYVFVDGQRIDPSRKPLELPARRRNFDDEN